MLAGMMMTNSPPRVLEFGSIWLSSIAAAMNTAPDATGMLYLGNDGCLMLVTDEKDAPPGAHYVTRIAPGANMLRMAARLAHVAGEI
jgi:hypothetical protein